MKNKLALRLLLASNAVSGFAQGISMLAIPWYFTDTLKNPSLFAVIYGVITALTVFWSLYSGSLIDKYSRKSIFLGLNIISGIILLSVSFSGYLAGEVAIPLIILVFATTMLNYNIHYPALYAFGQELTNKENYGKFNSLLEVQGQATSVLAGAFATLLLSGAPEGLFHLMGFNILLPFPFPKWTLQDIFLMDGITYIIAIVLIGLIQYTPTVTRNIDSGSIIRRIKVGFKYLKDHPLIFMFGNTSYSIFVVLLVEVFLLLPMYISNHLKEGADAYASSEIFYAIGALFAGIFVQYAFRKVNTINAIIFMMILTSLIMFITWASTSLIWFYVFSVLIGIANAGTRVLRVTYLLNHIPNNVIGRTGSVFGMINIILRSIFILIFSLAFFSEENNVIWTYFICASFVLLSMMPIIMNHRKLIELKPKEMM